MSFARFASLLLVVALVWGCEGPRGKAIKVQPPSPAENAKAALKEMADSGQTGSGLMMIRENFEAIQKTDAAKGGALLKELEGLNSAKPGDDTKAKAKALMEKL
jgi:hypothetical protein